MTESTNSIIERATPDPRFNAKALYDVYRVSIRMRGRLYGGTPKNAELIESWVKARTKFDDDKTEIQTQEALDLRVDEVAEKGWCGFQCDDRGLLVSANNLKAMLKQGASMLGMTKKKLGSKQIFAEGMEVKGLVHPSRIYLGCKEPHGFEERPIHVVTAQGPRTALKRSDYVEFVTLEFEIWVLHTHSAEKRHIGEDELIHVLTFSQENGFGADRSQGAGKFDVMSFECIAKPVDPEPKAEDKPEPKKRGPKPKDLKDEKFYPADAVPNQPKKMTGAQRAGVA